MACNGHPRLCCDAPQPCCTHRRISDAPSVVWSANIDEALDVIYPNRPACFTTITKIATSGSGLYLVVGGYVVKYNEDGVLQWTVGIEGPIESVGEVGNITAITASGNYVWVAGVFTDTAPITGNTLYGAAIVQIAASDGAVNWVYYTDPQLLLDPTIFGLASDGNIVYSSGAAVVAGGEWGTGVAVDVEGHLIGTFGFGQRTGDNHPEFGASSYIVVGGGAIYIAGGWISYGSPVACVPKGAIGYAGPNPVGVRPFVSKWDASSLEFVWAAGGDQGGRTSGPMGIRTGSGLYVTNRGMTAGLCNLELWDENTAEPQWGVEVTSDYTLDGVTQHGGHAEIVDLSISDASQLWLLARHDNYITLGSPTPHGLTEQLRQYDTSGSLTACCPSYYRAIAAFGSGVFAAGYPHDCVVPDSAACPSDTTCTPEENCDASCGECNIYGDMVIAECECLDGIGDACITVESLSCPGLNSGEQPTRTFVGEGGGGQWYLTYEIDPDPACGTPPHQVDVSVLYDCDTGWSCEVIVSFENGTTTYTITDFEQSASCDPITVTFQANGIQDVAECMGCDVDLDLMVRLDSECAEAMMAAPQSLRAASSSRPPARLMVSIDGPADAVGLLLERDDAGDWTDAGGLLRFNEDIATIGDDDGPVTILSRRPFVAIATVGPNELIVTEEP